MFFDGLDYGYSPFSLGWWRSWPPVMVHGMVYRRIRRPTSWPSMTLLQSNMARENPWFIKWFRWWIRHFRGFSIHFEGISFTTWDIFRGFAMICHDLPCSMTAKGKHLIPVIAIVAPWSLTPSWSKGDGRPWSWAPFDVNMSWALSSGGWTSDFCLCVILHFSWSLSLFWFNSIQFLHSAICFQNHSSFRPTHLFVLGFVPKKC